MILLLGGTSESVTIAAALAQARIPVLISMATEVPLELPESAGIQLRRGRLNQSGFEALIREHGIVALVDAAHPFALEAHATAAAAAQNAGIPYLRWLRPPSRLADHAGLHFASSHYQAARMATAFARPILLTVGSRNLMPYVAQARCHGLPIYVRLLPCEESRTALQQAGLDPATAIFARGPFSMEDTLELIQRYNIGVLVTKESGAAGGVPEKLEACATSGCTCVLVRRQEVALETGCSTISALLAWLAGKGVAGTVFNAAVQM